MRKPPILALIAALLLLATPSTFAWSGGGHMVIAAEAFKALSPELKAKVTEILKAHPDYASWEQAHAKAGADSLDLPLYIIMRASTWPDEIRRGRGGNAQYDHPHWHYVDYPLRPPKFPMEPAPIPEDDVVFGIAHCEKVLSDAKASPEERAVYLSYLMHLVGDIHQPLHCSSLFTEAYPKGDKGGNDFYVSPGGRGIKLHSLWDQLLGTSRNMQSHVNYAAEIEAKHPRRSLPELASHKTAKEWSLEGRNLAIEKAYLDGKLKGSTEGISAPGLPEGYTKEAKVAAEKQAALAGYRLGDEIRGFVR